MIRAYRVRKHLKLVDAGVSSVEDLLVRAGNQKIDRPIFILGNYRSGTTLLQNVLGTHPSLGYFTYTTSAFPRSPRFADLMRRLIPGLMEPSATPHQPNIMISGDTAFEAEAIWRFCRNNIWTDAPWNVLDADFSDPPFEALLRRTIVKQLALVRRPRFLDKNPPNTVRLGFLSSVFPDARFIYIVRHPLRMLRSQLDMEQTLRRLFPDGVRDYGEAFSNLWLPRAKVFMRTGRHAEIAAAFDRDPPLGVALSIADVHAELVRMVARNQLQHRVYTLRYEDLIARFEPEMMRLLAFVDLEDDAARTLVCERKRFVDETLLSRRSPMPRFPDQVLRAVRPLLEQFSYRAE